jgi:PHD/YefM family antitoxin component YafN of YafNO toxin-antitoxin module
VSDIGGKFIAEKNMIELHPEILEKNGRKEFAILPYEEYVALTEALADYEDLRELRAAKAEEGNAGTMSLKEASKRYGAT